MSKNRIIQFLGFITRIDHEEFVDQWQRYANEAISAGGSNTLLKGTGLKSRYDFISRHESLQQDAGFDFMKERAAKYFPDQKVKVIRAGGYTPVKTGNQYVSDKKEAKIMAFIGHLETDAHIIESLPYQPLNTYTAYYENCTFGSIMEFATGKIETEGLLQELKKLKGIEVGMYKECFGTPASAIH